MKIDPADRQRFFHCTSYESAFSILRDGLRDDIKNKWGGGELGPGFYTSTTQDGAAMYFDTPEVVIEFIALVTLDGVSMSPPQKWDQTDKTLLANCENYDFIVRDEKNPTEYKFNHRSYKKIAIKAIHILEDGLGKFSNQKMR